MELKDLYRDVILDHNKRPRNFGQIERPDARADGHNPLCGDRLTLSLKLDGDKVEDVRFEGKGCAISTASASLMTEAIKGKDRAAIDQLFHKVHTLLTEQDGQACRALGCPRVPGPREVRQPVLAHPERRARAERGHCPRNRFH
jgi:SUF system NifU family Fe-S assembly protein